MKLRVLHNKKNGQCMIPLPKKDMPFLKRKTPKFLNLPDEAEWEF